MVKSLTKSSDNLQTGLLHLAKSPLRHGLHTLRGLRPQIKSDLPQQMPDGTLRGPRPGMAPLCPRPGGCPPENFPETVSTR